jgi:hypothetical protein
MSLLAYRNEIPDPAKIGYDKLLVLRLGAENFSDLSSTFADDEKKSDAI